jgi:hypothetical protein
LDERVTHQRSEGRSPLGAKTQSQDINSLTRDKKVGIAEFEDKMPKLHLFNSSSGATLRLVRDKKFMVA